MKPCNNNGWKNVLCLKKGHSKLFLKSCQLSLFEIFLSVKTTPSVCLFTTMRPTWFSLLLISLMLHRKIVSQSRCLLETLWNAHSFYSWRKACECQVCVCVFVWVCIMFVWMCVFLFCTFSEKVYVYDICKLASLNTFYY